MAIGDAVNGEIKVAARVIDFLSSGLYKSPAACLKELVNNSYDADATEVRISVKPDADVISIEDDGTGMDAATFQRHFDNVAESRKRDSGEKTASGRLKIGKIGIGFIAANELCDEMELYSTMQGSRELLHVVIEFGEIRERSYADRSTEGTTSVKKGDYHGDILSAGLDEHYTFVYLKRIRKHALEQFLKSTTTVPGDDDTAADVAPNVYGKSESTVLRLLTKCESWSEFDLYTQTRLKVALNVPVRYMEGWAPERHQEALRRFEEIAHEPDFRVIYDGTELLKPIVLTEMRGRSIVQVLQYSGEHIEVSGYLFARHGSFKPVETNGVLVRVRGAAVGEYDGTFLDYPKRLNPLFQGWTSGELYVNGKIDDALNIDRRTLRETHPAYVELQTWFLKELGNFLASVRSEFYQKPSDSRSKERAKEATEKIAKVASSARSSLGDDAARAIEDQFPSLPVEDASPRQLKRHAKAMTRTYQVSEILDVAVEIARDVLEPKQAEEFLREFGRRLSER